MSTLHASQITARRGNAAAPSTLASTLRAPTCLSGQAKGSSNGQLAEASGIVELLW